MPRTTGWALIGAGRHPELRIAPAIAAAENACLRGVWSRDPEKTDGFAARHGAERAYRSVDEALADREVDAVFISTPNALHAEHTIAAARAGKHILVEKPMAVAPGEAADMVRSAREHGVRLGVGYHMRHHALHRRAREIVAAGTIGDIRYATASFVLFSFSPPTIPNSPWKSDPAMMGHGGALMGMGVHTIDLLRWLVGAEVATVSALSDGQREGKPLDSLAQITFEYDNGAHAHLVCSGRFPFARNDAVVYGSRGRIVCAGTVDMNPTPGHLEVTLPGDGEERATTVHQAPVPNHFQAEIEAFGRSLAEDAPFHADGVDGLRAVEITSAVIASLQEGRRVAVMRTEI